MSNEEFVDEFIKHCIMTFEKKKSDVVFHGAHFDFLRRRKVSSDVVFYGAILIDIETKNYNFTENSEVINVIF